MAIGQVDQQLNQQPDKAKYAPVVKAALTQSLPQPGCLRVNAGAPVREYIQRSDLEPFDIQFAEQVDGARMRA